MQKPVHAFDVLSPAAKAEDEDEIDLLGVARTLWRGKHWIALCSVLALSCGWYQANVVAVPLFTSTAQMALEVDSPPVVNIEAVVSGFSGDEASINTEMAIVRSGDLIGRLVDELHLERDPEFNRYLLDPNHTPGPLTQVRLAISEALSGGPTEAAAPLPAPEEQRLELISNVQEVVETQSSKGTFVFSVSATTTDPAKSQLMANTLARLYRDDQIRLKVEATERAAVWLSGRVSELRAELDARENEISALRASSALVSSESLQALNVQAIELGARLQEVEGQLAEIEERAGALQAADVSGDIQAKLTAAEDGQLEAAAVDLAASEPGAQSRFDRRFAQLLLQTQAERERAQKQVEELQRTVNDLSRQFEGQSADFQALQQLEQEAEAARVLYQTFLTRLKETSVQGGIQEADSRILTEARLGEQVAPRESRILAMALLLGLLLGAGVVLLREFLQNTFRTAEELERHTGQTVLGQFPRVPGRARPDTIEYLLTKPTSSAAEAIRNLRTSLLLSNVDRPPQVIMVTSSVPNEGKTTLAIALAQNLAGLDKRVLLIEGDIRRRTFKAYFQQPKGSQGILSVVAGRSALQDAIFRPDRLGIDVLAGEERSNINAADLFSSESFQRLLQTARSTYDFIIVDTPPVLVVPDARVIAQHMDAVVYTVHWDHTTKGQVEEGLRQFRSVNVPVTGVVLSQVDPKGMKRYGYGGRYGAYSRYGRGYYEA